MKNISIDIETFSDIDLNKCGVYRYAESPAFEILLFGYSVDYGAVTVIDLAQGDKIPEEILDALTDDMVIKWAFNAAFERICLSRYLRDLGRNLDPFHDNHPLSKEMDMYLNPAGWRCSMVWAATMGLPLSLKGVGDVLKLDEQKMDEGKALIKYFSVPCTPTKANGGRTRNMPEHNAEKWETFNAYNRRDVEVEMAIQRKLSGFPVSEEVWDEYHIDQEINDRGVRVDMRLVDNAIAMDGRSRKELTAAMRKITALDNPNSVQQMKQWLADNGLETDTLGKKAVAALLKDAPPELAEVLALRQQLAKSSVKKYQAMKNCVCYDGR
jgi:DNA polymerase